MRFNQGIVRAGTRSRVEIDGGNVIYDYVDAVDPGAMRPSVGHGYVIGAAGGDGQRRCSNVGVVIPLVRETCVG